jgi:hypothetical protein
VSTGYFAVQPMQVLCHEGVDVVIFFGGAAI